MSDVAIRVEGLGKEYRLGENVRYKTLRESWQNAFRRGNGSKVERETLWALKDVSFEVKQGEVVGVIGRNGAGKSTLLKVLSRIARPTTGRADIHGRVGSLLEVGTGFHPELTGRENIFLNGAILGMTRREVQAKFDEIVAFTEIEKFLDTPVKRYSSGMYVRLAFAVATHLECEVLMVDEVLAVGDVAFQKRCIGRLGELSQSRTVLFVSHQLEMVKSLCSRAVLLHNGTINSIGDTVSVVDDYLALVRDTSVGDTEIPDTSRRSGSGLIRFKRVEFVDGSDGTPLAAISTGDSVLIRFSYEPRSWSVLGSELQIGVSFYSLTGEFRFAVNNDVVGHDLAVGQEGITECLVPRWPLPGGSYYCSMYSEVNGGVADFIESVECPRCVDGDYFGTGYLPARGKGGVVTPFMWVR